MFIKSLVLENFKGTRQASYEFGRVNEITGDNGTGKTTIAEAIVFALFGTTLSGSNKTEALILQGEEKCSVSIAFVDGAGREHVLTRIRGKSKQLSLTLDGRAVTQPDVDAMIGDRKAFMAAFWPTYVLGLSDAEARELFVGLLQSVPFEKVLEQMEPEYRDALAGLGFDDPQKAAARVREQIKAAEKEVARLEGALSEALRAASVEVPEGVAPEKIRKLQEEYEALSAVVQTGAQEEVAVLEREVARLAGEFKHLKEQYKSLTPRWKPGDRCPTCGQVIGPEALAAAERALEAAKKELEQRIREVGTRGKALQEQLKALKEKRGQDTRELAVRQRELLEKITAARERNAARESILRQKAEAVEKARQYQEELEREEKWLEELRARLQAITQYAARQAELMASQLAGYLKRVSVQLFDVVKSTGEIRPVFRLLYDGKPVQVLSASERVKLGLEVAAAVKQITGRD
ncbi:AAA domain-containing protein [Thermanaeromonas toyohensis ToBE]|uniref:Nuclease SbcCD subunit C n=1 Tax=Thermanaeromonas toyohensis ToBE TaxID=698762 RepID=A0A1W1VUM1_9FIRM|nr:AAA family ATPase [Thermanaeromonas toyohensis]SMB96801.1 AAA domain-containing protein [Thermanaeromonas toyohensis ToBE]